VRNTLKTLHQKGCKRKGWREKRRGVERRHKDLLNLPKK
jgi:hypothetical protein